MYSRNNFWSQNVPKNEANRYSNTVKKFSSNFNRVRIELFWRLSETADIAMLNLDGFSSYSGSPYLKLNFDSRMASSCSSSCCLIER